MLGTQGGGRSHSLQEWGHRAGQEKPYLMRFQEPWTSPRSREIHVSRLPQSGFMDDTLIPCRGVAAELGAGYEFSLRDPALCLQKVPTAVEELMGLQGKDLLTRAMARMVSHLL